MSDEEATALLLALLASVLGNIVLFFRLVGNDNQLDSARDYIHSLEDKVQYYRLYWTPPQSTPETPPREPPSRPSYMRR